ncbi:seryl-tRNA synthetase [Methanoculleus taiwanensis]|uniref:Seryl-tRNA synthetase n=1 Tax=Methanoculleus taiwanensis TaxID=1550565 RepID=A0A498H563_9EURY|nr:serine--tRNA ligase [Methanoculleus taiwanensis]RXE57070.1 seryl-tRNA synthetase [Methanoculleus taiwanensis]
MFIRFALTADLQFSRDLTPEAVLAAGDTVQEANEVLFRRGVPAEAEDEQIGKITEWSAHDSVISLAIESGPYTRAHDALFRFRKLIAQAMGRHRLGLREITVRSFSVEIPGHIPDEAIPKLPFIRSVSSHAESVRIDLACSATDLENRVPDRIVKLIEEKKEAALYGGKTEHWELVFESGKRERIFEGNPTEEMLARGWIKHGASRGQWIFAPQAVALFRAFERIVVEEIIRPLGFSEMIFPKLVPWEVWMRSGHAKGVYPEIYYVCTPKTRDPSYWEDIADYFKVTGEVPVEMIRDRLDGPIGGMCYAQCPPFWPFVQGETLANDCLPIRVFDRSGTSHRYESGGIHGIERVDEFHRIEILWLGTAEQTIETANRLHETYTRVFEDLMELEWRSARVTPWFMAQEGMLGESGSADIGTRDYEALLPYSNSWLEFQNVSVNGDKYPKGFNVKIQSGADCWSGCSGIGLERWTAAFLAQKGFDTAKWPEAVARLVDEPKEIFRFL